MTPQQRAQQAAAAAAEKQAQQNAQRAAAAAAQRQAQANAIRQASANRGSGAVPNAGLLDPLGGGNGMKGADPVGAAVPSEPAAPPRKPFEFAPDSGYNDAVAVNKKRYDDSMTALQKAGDATAFDYGFDDPTNPFSRVAEQKKFYLAQGKKSDTSLNSRGMLLSGANLRAIDRNKRNEDKSSTELRAAYQAALDAIRRARGNAGTDQEEANLRARQDSYDRQLAAYNAS